MVASGCSRPGPKVTVCQTDPPNKGSQCYDERTGDDSFVPFEDMYDYVCLPNRDLELLYNYWRTKCSEGELEK